MTVEQRLTELVVSALFEPPATSEVLIGFAIVAAVGAVYLAVEAGRMRLTAAGLRLLSRKISLSDEDPQ